MPGKRTVVLLKNLSWRIASQWDLLGKGSFINDCRYPSNGPQNGWKVIKANGPSKLAKFMLTLCFNDICVKVFFWGFQKRTCFIFANKFFKIFYSFNSLVLTMYYDVLIHKCIKISPTLTSLLSQRRQFGLNCKKNIALKIAYKIVALFTENYPSWQWSEDDFQQKVQKNTFWIPHFPLPLPGFNPQSPKSLDFWKLEFSLENTTLIYWKPYKAMI